MVGSALASKIGILTTHPIQYQVQWFRELAKFESIDLTVYFCTIPDEHQQGEGFGTSFKWDIPLLDGYKYIVLINKSKNPTVSNFWGCDTPEIYNILKRGQFDAFIVNGWVVKSCLQLLWACRRIGIPCIVRGESNAMRVRPLFKRLVHRILLKNYSAFLAIGKSNRNFYLFNGVDQKKIFNAPYCVDNDRFFNESITKIPHRNKLRKQWNIEPNAIVFLFCAKFISKKRPIDLLEAFKTAFDRTAAFKNIHLLMVGEGELKSKCQHYAIDQKLPVTFTGFLNQTEIIRAYVVSDCLVLPSDHGETWGLVVNEAMACGIPAITSDRVGCHPDLIIRGKTGDVFPFGDIDSLADLLLFYIHKPNQLKRMGSEAQQHIKKYSYDEVVKGTLAALDYVCKK